MVTALDLSDRVVLVTGGVRGVGLGIARAFADAGAIVVTCSRSSVVEPPVVEPPVVESPVVEPVETDPSRPPQGPPVGTTPVRHVVCDVRDPEAVTAMVERIVAEHGRLDVLVNNAGGAPYAPAAEASPRFHAKVVELNLLAPLLVSQAANAVMQSQPDGGAIVMVSSVSGTRPSPGTAAYGAAKAGVDNLVKSLAVEWAPKVRVNAIDVGLVRTEQTDLHYGGEGGVAAIEDTIPLGRLADPREIGDVAVFLASPLASYVTGSSIAAHGGGEPPPFLAAAGRGSG